MTALNKQSSKPPKSEKFVKGGLAAALVGAITVSYTRKLLFGKPPKTWRQVMTYGAIATTLLYHQLDINEKYNAYLDHKETDAIQKYEELYERYDALHRDYARKDELLYNSMNELELLRTQYYNDELQCPQTIRIRVK